MRRSGSLFTAPRPGRGWYREPGFLGFVAHLAIWVVLLVGAREQGWRRTAFFTGLWVAGYVGSSQLRGGGFLFDSYVAVLDIVLVLLVFKGDLRLR